MKKFLSVLLALVMVLSFSTVAFAADETNLSTVVDDVETGDTIENEASFDVTTTANVDTGDNYADIVYSVTVEWTVTGTTIDVLTGGLYKWNPDNLKYELDGEEGAKNALALGPNNSVTVTIDFKNRSNAAVNYEIAYADNDAEGEPLTTSEAPAVKTEATEDTPEVLYAATGTIENADKQTDVATTDGADGTGHDFKIDDTKIAGQSSLSPTEAKYVGTVTIEKIADSATIADDDPLKLGTYTVTLSAFVAPAEEPEGE